MMPYALQHGADSTCCVAAAELKCRHLSCYICMLQVVDESYRKALALSTASFATSFNLAEHSILGDVRDLLMPLAPRIYARLRKLNVYEPGGFFREHKVCSP